MEIKLIKLRVKLDNVKEYVNNKKKEPKTTTEENLNYKSNFVLRYFWFFHSEIRNQNLGIGKWKVKSEF